MRLATVTVLLGLQILAQAIPVQDLDGASFDRRVCSEEVRGYIREIAYTFDGHNAGCDVVLDQTFQGIPPMMAAVCECSKYLDSKLANLYDGDTYDCVLRTGLWNVFLISRQCKEIVAKNLDPRQASVVVQAEKPCIPGVSCIHGTCSGRTCVCDQGAGTFVWGPSHPLWTGFSCDVPWCPEDCSGHGACDTTTGVCMCDNMYEGLACDVANNSTELTRRAGEVMGTMKRSPELDNIRASADGQLTPSPSPSPTLVFQFPDPSPPPLIAACSELFCGPNGYCNPSSVPPSCVCIGGFTGTTCKTPPGAEE
jgi:hypothetical protein